MMLEGVGSRTVKAGQSIQEIFGLLALVLLIDFGDEQRRTMAVLLTEGLG
jgi:hypothetical protein